MKHLLNAVFCVLLLPVASAQQAAYDLVIRNARIVDGTGAPWYRGDIAIRGDSIAAIAPSIDHPCPAGHG
ncbi:MAG TPA: hypothetical protein VM791_17105 [Vicinamibacterales bacterium]|nr:hypothetical protein [Vicinamibacterales bacterium]